MLATALALDPRPLQKRSVRENVRRRPKLVEQLLRRKQSEYPSAVYGFRNTASIVAEPLKIKGAGKRTGLQPRDPVSVGGTANMGP